MSLLWGMRHGVQARSTLANDTPGALKTITYVDSNGVDTNDPQVLIRLYNDTGSATTDGQVFLVSFDGDEETNPNITTPATSSVYSTYVVSYGAVANATWGWFTIAGYCNALVEGTTDVAKDDMLQGSNGNAYFIQDGGATRTTDSIAIATAAQATNSAVSTKVYLFGCQAIIG